MTNSVLRFALAAAVPILANPAFSQCTDADLDNYFYQAGCGTAQDCNDASPLTWPGANETCDGFDNNCNGAIDESCPNSCDLAARIPGDILVATGVNEAQWTSVAWTGEEYGVSWDENELASANDIYFARLGTNGEKIGADIRLTDGTRRPYGPSVVWTGDGYGLAWIDDRRIWFVRLTPSGDPTSPPHVVFDNSAYGPPSLVWDGQYFALSWIAANAVYFGKLDREGTPIGGPVLVSTQCPSNDSPIRPSLVWTGTIFGVAWAAWPGATCISEPEEVFFARLSATGEKFGADRRLTQSSGVAGHPAVAWSGFEFAVAWMDTAGGQYAIRLLRLNASGDAIGVNSLIREPQGGLSLDPILTWTGAEYSASWVDTRFGNREILFARMSATGTKMGSDLRVTVDPAVSDHHSQVWNGTSHAFVWRDNRSGRHAPYFARVGCNCADNDNDGVLACANDCDDTDPEINPNQVDTCNGIDDNCNSQIDEDAAGIDSDGDAVHNACDNCRFAFNPDQLDAEGDLDLPPKNWASVSESPLGYKGPIGGRDEAFEVHGRADYRDSERG
jgi:hypothetical protein